jgi:hypothetical protein
VVLFEKRDQNYDGSAKSCSVFLFLILFYFSTVSNYTSELGERHFAVGLIIIIPFMYFT